jgi:hypothetical protein
VYSPPDVPPVGRVFQLNAIVTLQEAHELSEVERRFGAAVRGDELFARAVARDGYKKLYEDD